MILVYHQCLPFEHFLSKILEQGIQSYTIYDVLLPSNRLGRNTLVLIANDKFPFRRKVIRGK